MYFLSFLSELGTAAPVRLYEDEVYLVRKHPPRRGARCDVVRGIRASGESTAFLDGNAVWRLFFAKTTGQRFETQK